jgi:hypothetical protein
MHYIFIIITIRNVFKIMEFYFNKDTIKKFDGCLGKNYFIDKKINVCHLETKAKNIDKYTMTNMLFDIASIGKNIETQYSYITIIDNICMKYGLYKSILIDDYYCLIHKDVVSEIYNNDIKVYFQDNKSQVKYRYIFDNCQSKNNLYPNPNNYLYNNPNQFYILTHNNENVGILIDCRPLNFEYSMMNYIKKYNVNKTHIQDKILKKAQNNKTLTSKERKTLLEAKLNEKKLKLRSDSTYCQDYINEKIKVDVDEVVKRMCQIKFLFDYCNMQKYLNMEYNNKNKSLFDNAEELALSKHGGYPDTFPWLK